MNRVNQDGDIHGNQKKTESSPFNRSASLRNMANEGSLSGTVDQSFSIRGYSANKDKIRQRLQSDIDRSARAVSKENQRSAMDRQESVPIFKSNFARSYYGGDSHRSGSRQLGNINERNGNDSCGRMPSSREVLGGKKSSGSLHSSQLNGNYQA